MMENEFKENKPTIFTGITPTGGLTIGHYLGVIRNLINLQKNYNIVLMIADLHALTTICEKKNDYAKISRDMAATLYACGLKEENCKIFIQSEISAHLELSYFLSSYSSIGKLSNMIQYKEKLKNKEISSFPLLYYPILMASDMLLYDADLVIVGEDQKQHLEFAKYLANKFNSHNGNVLKTPKFFIAKSGSKIMDLQDPSKKMSKSCKTSIFILDDEETIKKKIMRSKTDSEGKVFFDKEKKPGISNLLTIYSCFSDQETYSLEKYFSDKSYSFFKEELVKEVNSKFSLLNKKRKKILKSIDFTLSENCKYLKKIASAKVNLIKENIFLWKSLK